MKLPYITLWLISTVLGEVIGPAQPSRDCHVDNCLRAVAGNDVRFEVKSRRADCSRFMTPSTALPASTYAIPHSPVLRPTNNFQTICSQDLLNHHRSSSLCDTLLLHRSLLLGLFLLGYNSRQVHHCRCPDSHHNRFYLPNICLLHTCGQ